MIDYPQADSVFPPDISAPVFLFRDRSPIADLWRVEVVFSDGSAPLRAVTKGPRFRFGAVDPRCISAANELPKLTPEQADSRTWRPDAALWTFLKRHSVSGAATVTIRGYREAASAQPLSEGSVRLRTSADPVGAPIFYRDVPLMPAQTNTGVIQPLAPQALHLVQWRVRDIGAAKSRTVLQDLPVCANCHSFSSDGKAMGMDLDGLQRNKGLYTLTPTGGRMTIGDENLIQWRSAQGRLRNSIRAGFMSRLSPDGRYVLTAIDPAELDPNAGAGERPSNYYVTNYADYAFLQVFFPTRGVLAWYSRESGVLQPLSGADDRRFVQFNGVWSPDQSYVIFARAAASDPNPPGAPVARYANDPLERQVKFDLYRVPFRAGQGGAPQAVEGASQNGMSNTFPRISPDGKWLVYVRCRNGQLLRPDSELYIVPAGGGAARRMRCNTPRMNSWHSFSPNGRWMVFSSKARSPYTQMYLTHIDSDGNDSPPVLVENATAANRAVNLPEFVNLPPDELREIGGPALDYYRLFDRAMYWQRQKQWAQAAEAWQRVVALRPGDPLALENLSGALLLTGRRAEAAAMFERAREAKLRQSLSEHPGAAETHAALGAYLLDAGRTDEAMTELRAALELDPRLVAAQCSLGRGLATQGRLDEARTALERVLALDAKYAPAHFELGRVFERLGDGGRALELWRQALADDANYADAHAAMARAFTGRRQFADALEHWRAHLALRPNDAAALRDAAWILATSPEAGVRNGGEAQALAVRAISLAGRDALTLDCLAAAYAEQGRFEDALATARRAAASAGAEKRAELASEIERRAALYAARTVYREGAMQR